MLFINSLIARHSSLYYINIEDRVYYIYCQHGKALDEYVNYRVANIKNDIMFVFF